MDGIDPGLSDWVTIGNSLASCAVIVSLGLLIAAGVCRLDQVVALSVIALCNR